MKFSLLSFSAFLLTCCFCTAEMRTWTNTSNQRITAEIISYDKDAAEVSLRMKNKKEYTLALDTLSETDHQWLNKWNKRQEEKRAELAELNKNAGKTVHMKSDGDLPTSFHVYYPKNFDATKKHPLLILFSSGGNGRGILNNVRQGCDAVGWIAVGCDTFKNKGDEDEFDKRFTQLLPYIEKTILPDPVKLYLGGNSGGAWRAYQYSGQFDRPWKGVLAYGGWLGFDGEEARTGKNMNVAIVNGDKDDGANGYIERDTKLMKRRGCEIKLFSFPGGHEIANPEVSEQAMRWMDKE